MEGCIIYCMYKHNAVCPVLEFNIGQLETFNFQDSILMIFVLLRVFLCRYGCACICLIVCLGVCGCVCEGVCVCVCVWERGITFMHSSTGSF